MPDTIVPPQAAELVFAAFLDRLRRATSTNEVFTAAAIAHDELTGTPSEPYPEG